MDNIGEAKPRALTLGFWFAIAVACFYLLGAFLNPLIGVTFGVVFFAAAWGMRQGQLWAAIAATVFSGVPIVMVLVRFGNLAARTGPERFEIAIGLVLQIVLVFFFFRAAWHLGGVRGRGAMRYAWTALIALDVIFWVCFEPFSNPTGSMEDTLLVGDDILTETVTPWIGRLPRRGDIVVFHYPIDRKQTFVKRVVGVPGDRLHLVNKELFVNGARASEPWAVHKMDYMDPYRDNFPAEPNTPLFPPATTMLATNVRNGEVVVPADRFFVLGDNRDQSLDSRYWGFISKSDLIGRPVLIYASFDIHPESLDPRKAPQPTILNMRWGRVLRLL